MGKDKTGYCLFQAWPIVGAESQGLRVSGSPAFPSLLNLVGFLQEVGLGKSHSLPKGCAVCVEASLGLWGGGGMKMGGLGKKGARREPLEGWPLSWMESRVY